MLDGHTLTCDGLKALFDKQPDMEVVGEARDYVRAMLLAHDVDADVIIIDINMRGLDGVEAIRRISKALPEIKIIVLFAHPEMNLLREIFNAGASGCVSREQTFYEFVHAIKTVISGETYISSKASSSIAAEYVKGQGLKSGACESALTQREREVLRLLAEGKSSKEIARHINMSFKTVDSCRRKMMKKLNVNSLAELVKYAIRKGLTSLYA
jgi:DNA-binding NarL/FixJ family response regulator